MPEKLNIIELNLSHSAKALAGLSTRNAKKGKKKIINENKLELSCAKLKQAYASYRLLQQVMNKLWEVCEIKLKLKFEL